jgi:hypothetical protein
MNVLLSSRAEIPPGTRHDCGVFFNRLPALL